MSILSRLFGSKPKPEAEPVTYEGFRIFAAPMKDAGGFRVAARIEKDFDGAVKTHQLVRADVCNAEDVAIEVSIRKAKQAIDEQGNHLFDQRPPA
ncbi:hypothetical protein ACMU_11455 [Actibacterium mucosum KCTC 23349]|uniref:Transcriptional activator HlyU n=1 Tax=Actibacterium mucosum KCTC 23349 TaxID=1454373 RepID=A0A037ZID0_9RHOB|nr:HlyU family transcriptional regulator [Actibacterium mucosum]KAJ55307.1 hypothetical protein ACMU_11455 [Actibacterium mucosum KCTC 23349]